MCYTDGMTQSLEAELERVTKERDELREALGLMVYQYCVADEDRTELDHQFMSAGENAFRVLGLEQYGDIGTLESWLFPEYGNTK